METRSRKRLRLEEVQAGDNTDNEMELPAMERGSRKRLKLIDSLADNSQKEEVQAVTVAKRIAKNKNFENTGKELDTRAIIRLYDNGEYTQQMLDQALSIKERFTYFYSEDTKVDRAVSFLFKSEQTKVVDIRTANHKNYNSVLYNYYDKTRIIFPQILAQLCPNIIEFHKMDSSKSNQVEFHNEYKKNIPKYSKNGPDNIPKNKFSDYIDRIVNMPHIVDMMINKMGVDGMKVMMEAFTCKQETVDAMCNLVREFIIEIDDTNMISEQCDEEVEEAIALLLRCPNTKIVDISLVTKGTTWSPILYFFNSRPSSFTQALAQLCPRIEQFQVNGNLIFDSKLFARYAGAIHGPCNLSHVKLSSLTNFSETLDHYINNCKAIKSIACSLIDGRNLEANNNLHDKLKHVKYMKIEMNEYWLENIDIFHQYMTMFTELRHITLKFSGRLEHSPNILKDLFACINALPRLTSLELDTILDINYLEWIRPSLIKNLSLDSRFDARPEQVDLITNLKLQTLTLETDNNIIPFVRQLNLMNLKRLAIQSFDGDAEQLFSAAAVPSQNIKFDFYGYDMESLRAIIDAGNTIFNEVKIDVWEDQENVQHSSLHEAITKIDSSRVRSAFYLRIHPKFMEIVQECEICQQLLMNNTIFHIDVQFWK